MTHIFKIFVVFVLLTTLAGCGQNTRTTQPIANPDQLNEKHDIHVTFSFDTGNDQGNRVSGFRLYKEGKLLCEAKDPKSRSIDCNIASPGGSFLFTITTIFEDGSESRHSEPFSYTIPD